MNRNRIALVTLVILTSGVAAVTFAISFHGLDGYGYHVMRLGQMSPLVPVGVDLASLVALLAAHVRRSDRLGRRAYAWLVFLTTGGLSIAGNLADGQARGLAPAGLVGVAMAPVVFVLVSHLAITSWRAASAQPDATVDPVSVAAATAPSLPAAPVSPAPYRAASGHLGRQRMPVLSRPEAE